MADVPFARLKEVYNVVIHHLKGPKANQMREESNVVFCRAALKFSEDKMADHLTAWSQVGFIPAFTSRNKRVFEGCIFRPDFVWKLQDMCVMLECDEDAHRDYDKQMELERMQALMQACSSQYIVLIRFNPTLPGSTSELKFATLLTVLLHVSSKNPKYVGGGKAVIHLFYPEEAMKIWFPDAAMMDLVGTKRPREQEEDQEAASVLHFGFR